MILKLKAQTKLIILISSLASICLVVVIAINANRNLAQMSANNSELYSAYRISELMKSFKSGLSFLENKMKGYLITGDPKFLEAYKLKESETKTYLKSMEKYFSGKPEEEAFYRLKDLTYQRLMADKNLQQSLNLAGFQGNLSDVDVDVATSDEIRTIIEEINESLSKTTQVLLDNSTEYVRVSKKWNLLEVIIGVLVAGIAVLIVFRDINIRNKLEHELRRAKKQADDNAVLKEQFMANMSHEIRTPMNAILGFTDLLYKTRLDHHQADYLAAIRTSGSNLLNIINDILDFSKIEAGQLHLEKIPFSIYPLLDSLNVMFSAKAQEKNIHFFVSVDERIPPQLFGDPTRLTQILVNLINNAVKFTQVGKVNVSCDVKSIEHDMVQLVFRIRDTGIGIPAGKIDGIFERFNQGNKETTRKFGGTGLGLAIVKNLVEIQNGEIQVKSKEGKGSEFMVRINYPVSYAEPAARQANADLPLLKIADGSLRVLLVEDNALNQKLATHYLEGFGLQVDLAENGQIALDKLKNTTYDLVLTDIQMPVLDGYQTAKRIREELKLKLPVIAMTAHIMEGEREKCMSYGMNDYISKPFKEKELYDVLINHLDPGGANAPGSGPEKRSSATPVNTIQTAGSLDLNELYDIARGNKTFIKEMIDLFLEKNPGDLAEIRKALNTHNFETIRTIAHRMKSSVGFMGLKSQVGLLNEMELIAENETGMDQIRQLFEQVEKNCVAAQQQLKKELLKLEETI
jgi:signal transduction histidine kinase/CheY-like chemotaxis protein